MHLSHIKHAKDSGASAVKLQTYKPDTMTIDLDTPEFTLEGGCGMEEIYTNYMKKRISLGIGIAHYLSMQKSKISQSLVPHLITLLRSAGGFKCPCL